MLVSCKGPHAEGHQLTRRGQCQAPRSWARVSVRGREVHVQFVSRCRGRSPQKRHPKDREECGRGAESSREGCEPSGLRRGSAVDGKITEGGRTGRTEKQTEEALEQDVYWKLKFP